MLLPFFSAWYHSPLLIFISYIVDRLIDSAIGVSQLDAAARHHAFGSGKESLKLHIFESCIIAAFVERSHKWSWEAGSVQVHANAHHSAGVYHAVHTSFAVVAHDKSAELTASTQEAFAGIVPQLHFAIVVFEV